MSYEELIITIMKWASSSPPTGYGQVTMVAVFTFGSLLIAYGWRIADKHIHERPVRLSPRTEFVGHGAKTDALIVCIAAGVRVFPRRRS